MENGKVYCVGDTHGTSDLGKMYYFETNEAKNLTKDDVMIQLGDFGAIWNSIGTNEKQEELLNWWANQNYTLAVVLGNHEAYSVIDTLPWTKKWGNDIQYYEIENGNKIYFFKRGAIYTINNKKILTVSGAFSVDKYARTEGISWWAREDINYTETEFCLNEIEKHDKKVDYVLTHTIPKRIVPNFIL